MLEFLVAPRVVSITSVGESTSLAFGVVIKKNEFSCINLRAEHIINCAMKLKEINEHNHAHVQSHIARFALLALLAPSARALASKLMGRRRIRL